MQQQVQVIYSGNVQGVGFRYRTRTIAGKFSVGGYVRNQSNGTVELVAVGEKNELKRFMESIAIEMQDNIADVEQIWSETGDQYSIFEIRH